MPGSFLNRDRLEAQLALYESIVNDRWERVFNGWVRFAQIKDEIKFFQERVRNCRFLLG
jgi:hypothetical protein